MRGKQQPAALKAGAPPSGGKIDYKSIAKIDHSDTPVIPKHMREAGMGMGMGGYGQMGAGQQMPPNPYQMRRY